jgi:hypothetical protein
MENRGNSMDQISRNSSWWLWLGTMTAFAVFALSSGKLLLAAGMLLLGVFAFFNDPLLPTPSRLDTPTPLQAASWACGLAGVILILTAAVRAWL